jgi:hypothetical protein
MVGDRTILTIIFDDQTTVGMVRLYANEASRRLSDLFRKNADAPRKEDVSLAADYEGAAKDRLETLFPENR